EEDRQVPVVRAAPDAAAAELERACAAHLEALARAREARQVALVRARHLPLRAGAVAGDDLRREPQLEVGRGGHQRRDERAEFLPAARAQPERHVLVETVVREQSDERLDVAARPGVRELVEEVGHGATVPRETIAGVIALERHSYFWVGAESVELPD